MREEGKRCVAAAKKGERAREWRGTVAARVLGMGGDKDVLFCIKPPYFLFFSAWSYI